MDDSDFVPFIESNEGNIELDRENIQLPVLLNNLEVPWLLSLPSDDDIRQASNCSPLVRLHNEILTFCDYISPTNSELELRESVLEEITELIKALWPDCTVHVFGSQLTKILTPTSDLDIAILNVPQEENGDVSALVMNLADKIAKKNIASYCEAITSAKVPIVKLDHIRSGISIDICINNDSGLMTGKTVRKLVKNFPPLKPLTIVLKVFLAQRRLNDTYSGGVGSFLLSCMVASFLQMKLKNSKCLKLKPSWNLGALLLEFFHLYGITFNYYTVGISIRDGGRYFPKKSKTECDPSAFGNGRQNLLCLENPDSPDLDIGRSSFLLVKVRRAFEHAHQCLVSALTDYDYNRSSRPDSNSLLSFIIRADDPYLVGRTAINRDLANK